jgi:hypothetical protein
MRYEVKVRVVRGKKQKLISVPYARVGNLTALNLWFDYANEYGLSLILTPN